MLAVCFNTLCYDARGAITLRTNKKKRVLKSARLNNEVLKSESSVEYIRIRFFSRTLSELYIDPNDILFKLIDHKRDANFTLLRSVAGAARIGFENIDGG